MSNILFNCSIVLLQTIFKVHNMKMNSFIQLKLKSIKASADQTENLNFSLTP